MKKYNNVNDIKLEFLRGKYDFSQKEFMVDDVHFQFLGESTKYSMLEILQTGHKSMVVYNVVRNKENEEKEKDADLSNWIIFLWGMDDKLRLVPYDVRNTTKARASVHVKEGTKEIDANRIIADKVNVKFVDLPVANDIVAKVDTGAQITSMHATDIDIVRSTRGNTVSFNAPDISNNRFTLPLEDQQPVKTSNGETTNRPVIKLSLKIKNKLLKDILVNLNDRSKMDDPMLLGQNALEAGQFLVDPTLLKDSQELFSAEFLAEVAQEQVPSGRLDEETSRKLYETLNEAGDLSISELIKILRTEILNNLDDVSY